MFYKTTSDMGVCCQESMLSWINRRQNLSMTITSALSPQDKEFTFMPSGSNGDLQDGGHIKNGLKEQRMQGI